MLTGIVRVCPDCRADRIFVTTDDCDAEGCDYCCASCGAAVLIDPICSATTTDVWTDTAVRVA